MWQTALSLWSDPDVAEASLMLQACGCSVSRLLTAAWLAIEGRDWDGWESEGVQRWRSQHTTPLRQQRQALAKAFPTDVLREQIKRAELAAERIELAWIHHDLEAIRNDSDTARPDMSANSVYNEALLIRNLRAAAPTGDDSQALETGMNRLTQALAITIHATRATPNQGTSQ
ncbi:DUF2390 domain-containing protein [Marinobacter sp. JSM 1782161]|uniref:DUF2390 domain-containing protein n=1 Tax=Marinobacter sp. JSM 1782161 TaxID=2685906 RepID=UPI0014041763|nr:DUF2390 domain-containing protein [Marinobacter sp. JSM 1782161]